MDPMSVAEVFTKGGMFPDNKSVAECATKLIVGQGLNLTPWESMCGLHMINGKPVLGANLMAAAIKRSGKYDYRATSTNERCDIDFLDTRTNEVIGTTTWTLADAKRAGLTNQNWKKYPKAMLFARCISAGYREHCPDALGAAPVYVEQHGESEIPEPVSRPAASRVQPPSVSSLPPSEVESLATPPHEEVVSEEVPEAPREERLGRTTEKIPVSIQEIKKGTNSRGPWVKYGVTTDDGYQLTTFARPADIDRAIDEGLALEFKEIAWNDKYNEYTFRYADLVASASDKTDDEPPIEEEIVW
tara:strand:+ start:359 stop:1264 length:906 start_codon:yes stop_codon:yes gene_type:complete